MKKSLKFTIASIGALGFLACFLQLSGCSSAPTKVERWLFNVQTNYVPVTNVTVAVNPDGSRVTNYSEAVKPVYLQTKGAGETQITEIGAGIGNLFGVGGLVTTALGVVFGAWKWARSSKMSQTANAMAQNIQMIREFVKQLPNGTTYDNVLVSWIQAHQAEAGVVNEVIGILKNQVNNLEAKAAADQVSATIADLLKK